MHPLYRAKKRMIWVVTTLVNEAHPIEQRAHRTITHLRTSFKVSHPCGYTIFYSMLHRKEVERVTAEVIETIRQSLRQ